MALSTHSLPLLPQEGEIEGKIHIKHEGLLGKRMVCVQTMIEPNLDGKKELVLKQMTFG